MHKWVPLLLVPLLMADTSAVWLAQEAKQAEGKGDIVRAYLLYSQAAARDPKNRIYWAHSQALQSRAAALGAKAAGAAAGKAPSGEPDEPLSPKELLEAREMKAPVELADPGGARNLMLRGNPRALFEQTAAAWKVDVVFDRDYPAEGQPQSVSLPQVGFKEALRTLETVTSSFIVPIGERMFLVAKDQPQKRQELEPNMSVTVPLPEPVTLQEAQELSRSVQQLFEIQKMQVDGVHRLVLIRDRVSKARPAQQVLSQMLQQRPEVMVEVEFVDVSDARSLQYGITLPTSFPLVPLTSFLHNKPTFPSGYLSFLTFGGGMSRFALGVIGASGVARETVSRSSTLLRTQVRSLDGQAATLHIGDRYPIVTSGYYGSALAGANPNQVYRPPPSFTFEDLGLTIKITPHVHGVDDVTLDLETEFKVLGGATYNEIPTISNRQLNSKVRLREGEWAIVGGLISHSDARTLSGLAGVLNIPVVNTLLGNTQKDQSHNQVMIVIKPHLLAVPASEYPIPALYVGTESRNLTQM